MGLKDILKKVLDNRKVNQTQNAEGKRLSPEEVELNSYKREEARDKLRQELGRYRLKKNREIILGNTFVEQARKVHGKVNILGAKNAFNSKSVFNNKESILKTKPIKCKQIRWL